MSQGAAEATKSWERSMAESPSQPSEETNTVVTVILDFWPPEL